MDPNASVTMAGKDLKLLLRDKAGFFFTFLFPLVYASFFGMIFAGDGGNSNSAPPDIPLLVVDLDDTDASRSFIAELDETALAVQTIDTRDEARRLVRTGKSTAFLVIPKGYAAASETMFYGDPPRIEIGIDPARAAIGGMIEGLVTRIGFGGMQKMFTDSDFARERITASIADLQDSDMPAANRLVLQTFLQSLDAFLERVPTFGNETDSDSEGETADSETEAEFAGWQPLILERVDVAREKDSGRIGPRNSYEISFPQAILWGILGCAAGFAISMVTERVRGTLVRLRMAPISRADVLAGKALACFVTTTLLAIVLLVFGAIVFDVRPDSIPLLGLAIVATSTCFVGIMMLLSVIGKTEAAAGGIGWAILMVMAMIGGGMIPVFFMPPWLVQVSDLSPVKWAILSLEGAIWRQFTLADMMVPVAILVSIGLVSFTVGAAVFRRAEA